MNGTASYEKSRSIGQICDGNVRKGADSTVLTYRGRKYSQVNTSEIILFKKNRIYHFAEFNHCNVFVIIPIEDHRLIWFQPTVVQYDSLNLNTEINSKHVKYITWSGIQPDLHPRRVPIRKSELPPCSALDSSTSIPA